jgi:hypothetical protein
VAVATGVGVPVAVGRGVIVALGVAVSIPINAVTGMDGAEVAVLVWVVEAVADSSTWDELFAGKDGVATGRVAGADVVPSAPEIGRQAISADIARYAHNNCCMSNSLADRWQGAIVTLSYCISQRGDRRSGSTKKIFQ